MSFHFEYVARNKRDALHHLKREHAPASVQTLLAEIIGVTVGDDELAPLRVKAIGHVSDPKYPGGHSSAQIEVTPIVFVDAAPLPAPEPQSELFEEDGA